MVVGRGPSPLREDMMNIDHALTSPSGIRFSWRLAAARLGLVSLPLLALAAVLHAL